MNAVVAVPGMQDNPYFAQRATELFDDVEYLDSRPDETALAALLETFDVLIIGARERITPAMLTSKIRAKIIGTLSVGLDHLCMPELQDLGIMVVNAPTANTISVAEHVVALVLALAKEIPAGDQSMRNGKGRSGLPELPMELEGKTMGLVGVGRIGTAVGRMAAALGMEVHGCTGRLDSGSKDGIRLVPLHTLAASSDIISISVPLLETTRGLIGPDFLDNCQKRPILINTSRIDIVDHNAVRGAILAGAIRGYGADLDEIPPVLKGVDRVLITPHVAGLTKEADRRLDQQVIDGLAEALASEPNKPSTSR